MENNREGEYVLMDIKERAMALNQDIVEWRRYIHQNPETGFETTVTEEFLVNRLQGMGIKEIRKGIAGHGLIAVIRGGLPGKVLGIRADIDALDITEETGLPFASTNGKMHACGHDAHAAMLLGAAKILMENREDLCGTVKLIFQPFEEGGKGALAMIEEGVLEGPSLDGIIGLHTGNLWKGLKAGQVGYRFGALMAGADWFEITFHGKGGHGATPHLTVDPIAMACQAVSAIQTIVSRESSPLDSAVVTVAQISGGNAKNIIAPSCTISGTLRFLDPQTRKMLQERLREISENVARAMRGRAEVEFTYGPPPVINDRQMTEKLRRSATALLGEQAVAEVAEPTMGGEDMAFFMEKVPGTFFFHPSSFDDGTDHPHHHPRFDVNEKVLWIGSAVMAKFALTWQEE